MRTGTGTRNASGRRAAARTGRAGDSDRSRESDGRAQGRAGSARTGRAAPEGRARQLAAASVAQPFRGSVLGPRRGPARSPPLARAERRARRSTLAGSIAAALACLAMHARHSPRGPPWARARWGSRRRRGVCGGGSRAALRAGFDPSSGSSNTHRDTARRESVGHLWLRRRHANPVLATLVLLTQPAGPPRPHPAGALRWRYLARRTCASLVPPTSLLPSPVAAVLQRPSGFSSLVPAGSSTFASALPTHRKHPHSRTPLSMGCVALPLTLSMYVTPSIPGRRPASADSALPSGASDPPSPIS